MINHNFRLFPVFILGFLSLFSGCGGSTTTSSLSVNMPYPTAINPSIQRVVVGQTTTLNVVLNKAHTEDTAMEIEISFENPSIVVLSTATTSLSIQKGNTWGFFSVQGLKEGKTYVYAKVKGKPEDERVRGEIVVSAK